MKFTAAFLAVVLPILAHEAAAAAAAAPPAAAAAAPPAAAAAAGAAAAGGAAAAQTSLTLDPSVIAKGFAQNGQAVQEAGQVPSLTSTNNFINFCAGQTITNGQQIKTGLCNPAPMGQIPATTAMPSGKIQFPVNLQNLGEKQAFTIKVQMANMEMGNFVNANQNYFAAPQQLNKAGQIVGHTHVVIEQVSGLDDTRPTNPNVFAFFKGINGAADANGVVTADVTAGLGPGVYRLATINTAANHQPALVPIAQHGSLDDMVYFSVGASGAQQVAATIPAGATGAAAAAGAAAKAPAAAAAAGGAAAAGKNAANTKVAAAAAGAPKAPAAAKAPAGQQQKGAQGQRKQGGGQQGQRKQGGGQGRQGKPRRFVREAY